MKHVIEVPNIQKLPRIRPLLAMDYDGNLLRLPKVFVPEGFVDLDLPSGTMWAKCNVGASSITDYGHYFMWGDNEPVYERTCDWSNYKYANGASNKLTKYCDDNGYWDGIGLPDCQQTLYSYDDPASNIYNEGDIASENQIRAINNVITQSEYHSPTYEQLRELLALPSKWTTINGINGCVFYRKDEPDVNFGDWSILYEQNLWLYDSEYNVKVCLRYRRINILQNINNINQDGAQNNTDLGDRALIINISVSPDELEKRTKEQVNEYLTEAYSQRRPYEGKFDIDTMLFLDSGYKMLAVEGENYTCATLPENFDENYMLFIPAAGYKNSDDAIDVGAVSVLWSSQVHFNRDNDMLMQKQNSNNRKISISGPFNAYSLFLSATDTNIGTTSRCFGYAVRAVYNKRSKMIINSEMAK